MEQQSANQKPNIVLGKIVNQLGRPLGNLLVQIYDRDMRSEKLLNECTTDKGGKYKTTWLHSQLTGKEKKEADLVVKVLTKEKKTVLYESEMDSIRFNASPREIIDITITNSIPSEVVEYEFVLHEVSFLADTVSVTDLQESKDNRDITFLSKEAEIPTDKIQHLVVSHRLQAESKIDAEFFYALLRKNTLLNANSFHSIVTIDINTEILPLLYNAALVDQKVIQQDVETAVKELIVSPKVENEWQKNVEQLQQYKARAEEYYKREHVQKVLDVVSRFVLEDKISEMGKLFQENKNNPTAFFQKITDPSFFKSDKKEQDAKVSIALGELLGFDENIISNVKESQGIQKPEDIKKLASLNKAGWKEILTNIADTIQVAGKPLNKDHIDLHASSLARKMEKEFPTTAFTAQLGREKKENSVLTNHQNIQEFLSKYEDFDLQHSKIDLFLKDKELTAKEFHPMKEELKSVQRIFKLVPHYGKTTGLLKQKIHSSQHIVALGQTRFVNDIAPKAGIEINEAKAMYKKAQKTTTAAMIIAGDLQETGSSMNIPAMKMELMSKKLEAVTKDFPNLKSLFKLTDVASCSECRSVYSPASYLVEILEFLHNRSVTDLTTTPHTTAHLARDVLFERRPDLGEIDLGCENAMTPMPYIDLVCELLEEAIAPDDGIDYTGNLSDGSDPLKGVIANSLLTMLVTAGIPVTQKAQIFETETTVGSPATLPHYLRDTNAVCKIVNISTNNYKIFRLRQTLSSAEELAAAPAYVNANAYNALKTALYAFILPFDLDHTEAVSYFKRFDLPREKLMKDFQISGSPADEIIAAEKLGLTDMERSLIVSPDTGNQQSYWNTTTANASEEMKIVDTILTKSGLAYNDLDLLLTLKFIDPTDTLFIKHLDLSADTTKKEIANLDDTALDRIHRFLRVQKKTGWAIDVLDQIISQSKLGNGTLDNNCLIKASALQDAASQTGLKISEVIGFYGEIPHELLKDYGPTPLYQQIFLNKAKNGFIDEGLLPEKVDGSQLLSNFTTSIAVCLQMNEQDLTKLLPLLPDGNLTFTNLSYLLAAARLMKKLKIKADDFIILVKLTGLTITDSPEKTLDFINATQDLQQSPLKPIDIQFMLEHAADNLSDRELKPDKILQVLTQLQKDFQANFSVNKSAFDPNLSAEEQEETLQNVLSKLPGVTEDDVKTFIKFIDRDWTSANDAKTFTDDKLSSLFDTSTIKSKIDALNAAPGPDISSEQKDLVKSFLDSIANYQLLAGKQAILAQDLATAYKADDDLINIILQYTKLKQPAPGTSFLSEILLSDSLIDTDPTHATPILPPISEIAFPDHYHTLRLLHKMIPLINAFQLDNQDVTWYFANNADLGWLVWDAIPYETGQTTIDYAVYTAFTKVISLAAQFSPVANPADAENPVSFFAIAEMLLPTSTATRDQFLTALSLLTGYDKDDLDTIDAYLFAAFSLDNYKDPAAWKAVIDCSDDLRKLGATVAQVNRYINPVLTSNETSALRTALKARYDEDTWLDTLKEITDAIRPQKRNALVAYLLATNPDMKDDDDLFDYFLVDVEMEACMPSSRIVQAHGSIQLFVQRCLMGLEPKAAADVSTDTGWVQWQWMKNYRLWEANRKVFLYPENWMDPDLRDNKSFLFTELENDLQQNELNNNAAEDGLTRYLEKLDNIAFLEVVATWYQSDIQTMHVFARTKGSDPALYYYRTFEQEKYWTPWEKIEVDITSDQLLAFVRNNRLTLAWPVFSDEPDPNPQSTVPPLPDTTSGSTVDNDKPKKKLKIQLALSEYANSKWQPKKISKDAILTPDYYTNDYSVLQKDNYNLLYFEFGEQVWIFSSSGNGEYESHVVNGVFNLTGCKGYPELAFQGSQYMPDFFPDFRDTLLKSDRYNELDIEADDLAERNALSFFSFYEILRKTPGTFRLTFPLQFTLIDLIAFIYEYLMLILYGNHFKNTESVAYYRSLKIPFGTLLPYFMEDSKHNYVIIPGFYKNTTDKDTGEPLTISRTGSNVLQFIEDIIALFNKYKAIYAQNPDTDALLQELFKDDDFHKIIKELKVYITLHYGEQFKNMYHPLVCDLRTILYKDGIAELMKRATQLKKTDFDFVNNYDPNTTIVPKTYLIRKTGGDILSYPIEDLDFTSDGSYSVYNWELFYHVPLLMATRLTQDQQFEDALTWYHYMFNPTGALAGDAPQKYWVTKPFYLTFDNDYINQRIDTLLYKVADPTTPELADLEFAIEQWRENPFEPDTVARFRPVAYQKALLMKYLDNLIEWGDNLFRQDTMESIAQATQMYILADKLLGPKPRTIPPVIEAPYETYNQIKSKLDAFGNALIDLENILPDLSVLPERGAELPPAPITLSMLYFCIPDNEQMLAYWDLVADRLFKIRHCQNIDGVEQNLALFAPPIDPGMLVRAAAAGLDISSILAGLNAPTPYYRFTTLAQKSTELAQEVRTLGNALLSALEKKDVEALSLLRGELEIKLLNAVKDMKKLQITEAAEQIEVLNKTKLVTQERHNYYANIQKITSTEQLNLDKLSESHDYQMASQIVQATASVLALIPDLAIGASGFGGSPHAAAKWGGTFLAHAATAAASVLTVLGTAAAYEASRASILGGYDRRYDDWKLQDRVSQKELNQIDQQIAAAQIRKEISETDLKNQELQIDNAKKTDDFMHSKFTNKELYDWMIGQISSVYFSSYQLAHDFAKKAERSYIFELGNNDFFIQYGYWDSLKKGLQSADGLIHDIKRMETSYMDKNKREYELTKHISLALLDPLTLVRLRATGVCDFEVPEALFDMDYAGQYFRRIKSVSITLPCIAGPYTSVSAKLSLVSNKYRKNTNPDNLAATGYAEDPGNDERFVYNVGTIQSIAASNAQNDNGMFELNFRDERYLPFEGCGAVSTWRLELPKEVKQFDYNSIADVILHIKYTAREGGSSLKTNSETTLKDQLATIKEQLSQTGLHVALNMRYDLANEWYLLKKNGTIDLTLDKSRLPYFAQTIDSAIENVIFIAQVDNNPASFSINIDATPNNLSRVDEWQLCKGNNTGISLDTPFTLSVPAQLAKLEDLMMIVKYSF